MARTTSSTASCCCSCRCCCILVTIVNLSFVLMFLLQPLSPKFRGMMTGTSSSQAIERQEQEQENSLQHPPQHAGMREALSRFHQQSDGGMKVIARKGVRSGTAAVTISILNRTEPPFLSAVRSIIMEPEEAQQQGDGSGGTRSVHNNVRSDSQFTYDQIRKAASRHLRSPPAAAAAATPSSTGSSLHLVIPIELLANFSMNGTVPVMYDVDTTSHEGLTAPHPNNNGSFAPARKVYTASVLNDVHAKLEAFYFPAEGKNKQRKEKKRSPGVRELWGMRMPPSSLFGLIQQYAVMMENSNIVVFGAHDWPVVEVAALVYGKAASVTTIEYTKPFDTDDHRLKSIRARKIWKDCSQKETYSRALCSYSVVFAIGAVEHDGLGRYGDSLNPFGDVQLMEEAWSLLKPGGLLFLTIPLGNDCLVFNLYRVYGRRRLPLLLWGWTILKVSYDFESDPFWYERSDCAGGGGGDNDGQGAKYDEDSSNHPSVEAVFVLQRTAPVTVEEHWKELGKVSGLIGSFPPHRRQRRKR